MDSLVSTDWLAQRLTEPGLLVLDASDHLPAAGRDAAGEFSAGHIPGARFLDLASLTDASSPVPKAPPTGKQLAHRLASLGWQPDRRIVIYDDSAVKTSARAWFALRCAGVRSALLDGGLRKWRDEGRPLATETDPAPPVATLPLHADDAAVWTKADILANLVGKSAQIVDARDPGRFTAAHADAVHGLPGGHIPGARNLFYQDLFAADGTFKPLSELRDAFARAGVDLTQPIVTSCGSGVTASVLLFALHLLGIDDAALYDGSWSEWGADPATPKAIGPA